MVFSASSATAYADHGDIAYYVKRQFVWLVVGLAGAFFVYRIDYQRLRATAPYLLVAAVAGLLLVFVPHVGLGVNGGRRWIGIGRLELAAVGVCQTRAGRLSRGDARGARRTHHLAGERALSALRAGRDHGGARAQRARHGHGEPALLYRVRDVLRRRRALAHLCAIALATVPFAALTVLASPYRRARIFAFVDPWKDPQNTGFHIVQSLLALGSGGIFGVGLGASRAKFFYLPEQYTDFIFSVLGEELGLIGALVVVALFVDARLSRDEDRDGRARPLRLLPRDRLRRDDRDSGVREHRRRHVVVAGDRRSAAVHLVWRQLAGRQPHRGRADRQRRAPPQSKDRLVP